MIRARAGLGRARTALALPFVLRTGHSIANFGGRESSPERRLGGSRWRLRRKRGAMGFESTLGWKLLY